MEGGASRQRQLQGEKIREPPLRHCNLGRGYIALGPFVCSLKNHTWVELPIHCCVFLPIDDPYPFMFH
jgi:hypothetical protein